MLFWCCCCWLFSSWALPLPLRILTENVKLHIVASTGALLVARHTLVPTPVGRVDGRHQHAGDVLLQYICGQSKGGKRERERKMRTTGKKWRPWRQARQRQHILTHSQTLFHCECSTFFLVDALCVTTLFLLLSCVNLVFWRVASAVLLATTPIELN